MDLQNEKCVIVVDEGLPLGILANTAAVLGMTLGKKLPEAIGPDVRDAGKNEHLGITAIPVPILRGDAETIKAIRLRLYESEFADLTAVDFSDVAQSCNDYGEFTRKIGATAEEELKYFGVAVCGAKKKVNKLTGSMPLLR